MAHLQARAFRPRLQQYLSQKELSRLLETRAPGLIGMRDRAMLSLLCETGLKASELVGLERDGFDPDEGCLLCGEGKRARCLPLSTSTQRNLREYLAVSDLIPEREKETALFVNHRGKRITRQGFWKILRNKGYECQLPVDLTPQLLRHSMAYHRLREGQSPESVRKLLGNEKISSLRGYIKAKEKGNGYF